MTAAQKTNPGYRDIRQCVVDKYADVLTEIYQPHNHLAVWRRTLPPGLITSLQSCLASGLTLNITQELPVDNTLDALTQFNALDGWDPALSSDIAHIVAMYGCLFDTEAVGLRVRTLNAAMCPRFHVDRVNCRLVTTYVGTGTQWLPHAVVNRKKLGPGSNGRSDAESGLYPKESDVQTLKPGDIALLKGSAWPHNSHGGIVHRSPPMTGNEKRLLLSLDAL